MMGTRRGDNEWRIDQNRQVAIGTDSNGMTFLVDVDDLPLVRNYTWIVDKRDGYVRSKITINGKRKTLLMHRIVMDTPIDKLTDHINHQKTDNRRSNLRVATKSQNLMNKPASGIYYIKGRKGNYKPWEAYISHEPGKMKTKVFATKEEAAAQRKEWEREYYGEYAYSWSQEHDGEEEMGTNYYVVKNKPSLAGGIHIGKSSAGWMFLFEEQEDTWNDPPVVWQTYEEVKDWLIAYTVRKKDYVIINEYDEIVPFADFEELVERKQLECRNNPDNFKYCKNINGYRFAKDFC